VTGNYFFHDQPMHFCHVLLFAREKIMHRPKRACTERAKQKILEILEWEECSEKSEMFKTVAAQMDQELAGEKKTDDYVPSCSSESDSMSENEQSEAEEAEEQASADEKE
jgi:hypothetical protein